MAETDSSTASELIRGDDYTGVENLEVMAEAVNYNRYLVDLVLAGGECGGTCLDFGAGAGTFARPVARAGLQVTCIEPDDGLRALLERDGLDSVADISAVPSASVDYVYTLNVLEHIDDDADALRELFRVLRPGGRLLVYVPAFQILYASMDRKVGHHRRYRLKALSEKIRDAGFSILSAAYADSLGFGAALMYRLVDPGDGSVNPRGLRVYDKYVFPLSRRLDPVLGRWFGKNVRVLAEKPDVPGS